MPVTIVALIACAAVNLVGAPAARADGDPARAALAGTPSFVPAEAGATGDQERQLIALLAADARDGSPIRVPVIASPADLGSVESLWRRPRSYAQFLGRSCRSSPAAVS